MIRIVLADDQALVRSGLRLILSAEDDLDVVAEVGDGQAALDAALALRPDVVCMDVRMPGTDGLAATRALVERGGPPVLVLTTFDDDDVLWGAVEAGAAGFVLKDTPADDLVAAIRATAAGGSWLDPTVTPRLLRRLRSIERPRPVVLSRLSEREVEVLTHIAHGATNPEIAERLYLSERTVKSHISSIFTKLDARDRAAAILIAYRAGLVDPSA